ncbi:type I-E CRISPR-associated protein Cse2/CasB [Streptomyces cyaneofuscatus]|uniref:type I-E CRISPR-associated protein Cse2/CasB n=1 Tax=Streptomyces cyaneofuscatus TaxID=66883 RepID=UPI0029533E55|nr:type I-E CRISPR-associated protein Cse2/CasB [Streptomyces cyaneofuscatus]WOP10493.1 type I-E CRISPR-associated protein Cse2/CasB [Streptomyces cyaneofuscatus]
MTDAPHSTGAPQKTDEAATEGDGRPIRYWHRYRKENGWRGDMPGGPPGEELAALRAGLGSAAASVPSMWPYYTTPTDGRVTHALEAEHGALALYGLHQQSQSTPMHRRHVPLGRALHELRLRERFSSDALDRRVAATVESEGLPALLYRLRMMIPNLRAAAIPLDYDVLLRDLSDWQKTDLRQRVRRRWGLQYYVWGPQNAKDREKTSQGRQQPGPDPA